MRLYLEICLLLFCWLGTVAQPATTARTGVVRGAVISKNERQPVQGALVLVVGDTLQQQTEREGRFQNDNVSVG